VALSRPKRGFESRWGRQPSLTDAGEGCPAVAPLDRTRRGGGLSLIRDRELRLGKPASSPRPAKAVPPKRRSREGGLSLIRPSTTRRLASESARIDAPLPFRIYIPRVHLQLTPRETLRRSDVGTLALTMRMEEMRFVYVLRSDVDRGRYYSGITSDVTRRLAVHNSGGSRHTATLRPWQLVASVQFASQRSAALFERYLKTGSGRAFAKRHFI
jgi:putative endonuclease